MGKGLGSVVYLSSPDEKGIPGPDLPSHILIRLSST